MLKKIFLLLKVMLKKVFLRFFSADVFVVQIKNQNIVRKGVCADGNSNLSDEIGMLLNAALGLRPVGAVIFLQRNNLKLCLRNSDSATDTSEVAKVYGGGGYASSSSFIIRMDEYNQWISANSL
ncbi:uncharacterized protein LOC131654971 [Vicia villosa]|uniref:uncharacterized protein LOC131654971 n=1 Tax=Vicia villosa TaxID=3911 RepID=UPI00273B52CD|nr:uncharacterized protein LOC131654971 [Vicia villosa]